jgi:phosphonate transport system substrate-binding protein
MKSFLFRVLFIGLISLSGFLFTGCTKSSPRLVIALKPDKDPEKMLEERKTLSAFLSQKCGQPVDVIVPLSSAVILEGFANQTIDLAYLSSTEMIKAIDQKVADLLFAGEMNGKTTYLSYWLCLKEKPYSKIDDLRGKPIAFASKTSTSGYIIPHFDLIRRGLLQPQQDPALFFGSNQVWYGSGYVSAVERLFSGEAEAAAVSDYVFEKEKHLNPEQKSKLRILQSQGDVPTHTLAIRSSISAEEREKIKSAIESLNTPENESLRNKVFTSKLVAIDAEAHLKPLREALQALGK